MAMPFGWTLVAASEVPSQSPFTTPFVALSEGPEIMVLRTTFPSESTPRLVISKAAMASANSNLTRQNRQTSDMHKAGTLQFTYESPKA